MSRLLALRDAIIARIKEALPAFDVDGHLGRFTEEQLREFMVRAPAVRVAVLALEDAKAVPDQGVDYRARIGIYVVTKDGAEKLSREVAAFVAVERILLLADRTRWGLRGFVKLSEGCAAQNLFTNSSLGGGVALWAIDLKQPIRLDDVASETRALGEVLLGVAPNIGAAHQADYVVVGGAPHE